MGSGERAGWAAGEMREEGKIYFCRPDKKKGSRVRGFE